MIKNYLILAIKVLRRKPFYTFISLFGISFTLLILMLLTSLLDASLGKNRPLTNRDNLVVAAMSERILMEPDTSYVIDTVALADGGVRMDSTESITEEQTSNSMGSMSYRFINDNLMDLESPERVAVYSSNHHIDGFIEGRKFTFNNYYTDAEYWNILDFDFLYGGPYNLDDVRSGNRKAVLTDRAAKDYFGKLGEELIGQEMELGRERFTVAGIISRPLASSDLFSGDIYLPITTADPRELNNPEMGGGFQALYEVAHPDRRQALKEELGYLAENFSFPAESSYNTLKLYPYTMVEYFAHNAVQEVDTDKALRLLFIPLAILMVLFVALPLINLINLNITRVSERRAEIGVRKAFGADARDILYQFIFENLVITVIGGLIGMLLASGLIAYINANDLLGIARLSLSMEVLIYYIVVVVLFGLLSGILPAYRISRTNVATALRG